MSVLPHNVCDELVSNFVAPHTTLDICCFVFCSHKQLAANRVDVLDKSLFYSDVTWLIFTIQDMGRGQVLLWSTYTANMLRGNGLRPSELHQTAPLTREGCRRLCRQRQPEPGLESEHRSEQAHSFTVSSLAQVSKI